MYHQPLKFFSITWMEGRRKVLSRFRLQSQRTRILEETHMYLELQKWGFALSRFPDHVSGGPCMETTVSWEYLARGKVIV